MERIAKFIARAGVCSRREAERLITAGRISINGEIIDTPAIKVDDSDKVALDDNLLAAKQPTRLWIFNKPAGVIVSNGDPEGRETIFDILPTDMPRVISVGRLDYNSEGLLLLTNDGELARYLELPKNALKRIYRVRAYGFLDESRLRHIEKGALIDGVQYAPAKIEFEKKQGGNSWFNITITEGKNREIRKMIEYAGGEVNRLIRIAYGEFKLGELKTSELKEVPPSMK